MGGLFCLRSCSSAEEATGQSGQAGTPCARTNSKSVFTETLQCCKSEPHDARKRRQLGITLKG